MVLFIYAAADMVTLFFFNAGMEQEETKAKTRQILSSSAAQQRHPHFRRWTTSLDFGYGSREKHVAYAIQRHSGFPIVLRLELQPRVVEVQ